MTRRYTHTVEWLNRPNASRAKKMVRMRADGWTYAAIGKKYKVSRQRAHQIVKEAGGIREVCHSVPVDPTSGGEAKIV